MKQQSSLAHKPLFLAAPVLIGGFLFLLPSAHAAIKYLNGTITTSTSWSSANTYIIQGSSGVGSGGKLTIGNGTVVKFAPGASLDIAASGTLSVTGTATKNVYFTSLNDNSVGSSTASSTGTPAAGDWDTFEFDPGSSSTIKYATIRYGGEVATPPYSYAELDVDGGNLNISNSQVSTGTFYGLWTDGGTVTIATSSFNNQDSSFEGSWGTGVYDAGSTSTLTITSSSFSNNQVQAVYINLSDGQGPLVHSGNTASGTDAGFVISGTTATSTTWDKDSIPYIIDYVTVASGTTLTVNHGAIIKTLGGGPYLDVQGNLNVQGTSTDPVYFTSMNDNSVGGTTGGSSTSTPAAGDWDTVAFDPGSSSTITDAIVRYGGTVATSPYSYAELDVDGGNLNVSNSQVSSGTFYGLWTDGGQVNITSSTFSNQSSSFEEVSGYGIYESGSSSTLAITSSTFANNQVADAYVDLSGGINFVHNWNRDNATTTGTGYRGFLMSGTLATNTTWDLDGYPGMPYVIKNSVTVASGTTLNISSGTFTKFASGAYVDVAANGTLNIDPANEGLETPPYFTSLTDDSVAGDTNADGTSTTPQPGDGGYIEVDTGGESTINNSVLLYGGDYPGYSDLYQNGGTINLSNVIVGSSSNYGIYSIGGTTTAIQSFFLNNPYGIWMNSGSVNVESSSSFEATSSGYYGFYNNSGVTSTANATKNYWNSTAGPYNATSNPSGNMDEQVSNYVNYNPWISGNSSRIHFLMLCGTGMTGYNFCSSVKSSSTLTYHASTTLLTALNAAVSIWQPAGPISITSTTAASSTGNLNIMDIDLSDVDWAGIWLHDSNATDTSSTIQFNTYYASTYAPANQQNLAGHEFGHALGLGDEDYPTNLEFVYNTAQTTLGSQDTSDYDYLW